MYVIKDGISLQKVIWRNFKRCWFPFCWFLGSTTAPPSGSKRVTYTPNGAQFRVAACHIWGAAIPSLSNTKWRYGSTVTDPIYQHALLTNVNINHLKSSFCAFTVIYSPSSSAKPMFNLLNSGCFTKVSIPFWPPTSSSGNKRATLHLVWI